MPSRAMVDSDYRPSLKRKTRESVIMKMKKIMINKVNVEVSLLAHRHAYQSRISSWVRHFKLTRKLPGSPIHFMYLLFCPINNGSPVTYSRLFPNVDGIDNVPWLFISSTFLNIAKCLSYTFFVISFTRILLTLIMSKYVYPYLFRLQILSLSGNSIAVYASSSQSRNFTTEFEIPIYIPISELHIRAIWMSESIET